MRTPSRRSFLGCLPLVMGAGCLSSSETVSDAVQSNPAIAGISAYTENETPVVTVRLDPNPTITHTDCSYDPATQTNRCSSRSEPVTVSDVFLYPEGDLGSQFRPQSTGQLMDFPLDIGYGTHTLVASVRYEDIGAKPEVGFRVSVDDWGGIEILDDGAWSKKN